MIKSELIKRLENIAEDADVDEAIKAMDEYKATIDYSKLTTDEYKKILEENPVIKAYQQSQFDSAVGSAVTKHDDKFKKEKLPGLIEEAVKAKINENLTPEQIEIKELKEKMAKMEADKEKAEKLNTNTQLLKDKNLPIELAKYINSDEDISEFENIISAAIQKGIDEKLGAHDETPPKGGIPAKKMTLAEIMAYANKHPEINVQELINQNK
ncbi:DUF4355 domain-containing protein [uncultured Clostridium sp.]|uniref:capsid assembly scaffolding protein Gp46 family protein n=1 Tax=uncultured Clostridium sp. TaxID=59620 RepID=UPI0025E4811A|nr:DUF4355 domain-containing protein [uncultured Clostridium sp.]